MSDRNLVSYDEPRLPDGPYWRLRIDRSAAGAPGLLFTIEHASFDGTLPLQDMTVIVEDGRALLAPVLKWLNFKSDYIAASAGDKDAAARLPMSDWAEARRAHMTPQTIAANHRLEYGDPTASTETDTDTEGGQA